MPSNAFNKADIGLGGPVQREAGNYQQQPVPAEHSDEELAKQIKVALTTGSTGTTGTIAANQLTSIDVKVQDGNVTLAGPVTSDAEKTSIGKQVAGFKGVKSVQNNLTVGGSNRDQKPLAPLVPRGPGNQ
jgi:osmotically-inducible protein OsmY